MMLEIFDLYFNSNLFKSQAEAVPPTLWWTIKLFVPRLKHTHTNKKFKTFANV